MLDRPRRTDLTIADLDRPSTLEQGHHRAGVGGKKDGSQVNLVVQVPPGLVEKDDAGILVHPGEEASRAPDILLVQAVLSDAPGAAPRGASRQAPLPMIFFMRFLL